MTKSKKSKTTKVHQQESYQKTIADIAQSSLKPFIEAEMLIMKRSLMQSLSQPWSVLDLRVEVLENIIIEKLGYTPNQLRTHLVELEDENLGLEAVGYVAVGDTVRFSINTKLIETGEVTEHPLQRIDEIGDGNILGEEIESEIIGMCDNESKTIIFNDGKMEAFITIDRISRGILNEEAKK